MQGKNTVVFVVGERDLQARLVCAKLNESADLLGIPVPLAELTGKPQVAKAKAKRVLNNYVVVPVSKFLHQIARSVTVREKITSYDGGKKKSVHNMFYRYAPDAVAVGDRFALATVKNAIKEARLSTGIFVYSEDIGFDYEMADSAVKAYFVDNITVRNELLRRGVNADRIFVGPLTVEKAYYREYDVAETRRRLGLPESGGIVAAFPTEENAEKLLDCLTGTDFVIAVRAESEGVRKAALARNMTVFDAGTSEADLFAACSAAAFGYDAYRVKRAAAMRKKTLLYRGEEEEPAAKYLEASGKAGLFGSAEEFAALLGGLPTDLADEDEDEERTERAEKENAEREETFDETDENGASAVADEIRRRLTTTEESA